MRIFKTRNFRISLSSESLVISIPALFHLQVQGTYHVDDGIYNGGHISGIIMTGINVNVRDEELKTEPNFNEMTKSETSTLARNVKNTW